MKMKQQTIESWSRFFFVAACVFCLVLSSAAEVFAQKAGTAKKTKMPAEPELTADDLDLNAELDEDTAAPVFRGEKKTPEKTAGKKTDAKTDSKTASKTTDAKKTSGAKTADDKKPADEKKTSTTAKKGKNKSPISDNGKGGFWVETPDYAAQAAAKQLKSSRGTKKKKPAEAEEEKAEDTRTPEQREQDRIKHFLKTQVWVWPELTEEDLEEIDTEQRALIDAAKQTFPQLKLQYYESSHFFFVTDAPQLIAGECVHYLEAMYVKLCEIFAIPHDAQIWYGKCTVVAFAHQEHFMQFEAAFYRNIAVRPTTTGLAHLKGNGEVLISLYFGDVSRMEKRWQFIGTMVHETTHGFFHRYKTRSSLPTWLEEGLCEFIAMNVVPSDTQVPRKQRAGLQIIRASSSVGGMLQAEQLDAWQYGVASGLANFLLKKPDGIKQMLGMIKDGTPWELSLKTVYGWSPEEMLMLFGRTIQVPGLKP